MWPVNHGNNNVLLTWMHSKRNRIKIEIVSGRLDGTAPQSWQLAALLSMLEKRSTEIWHTRRRFATIGRWYISCCSSHNFGRGQSSLGTQLAFDLRVRAMIVALVVVEVWSSEYMLWPIFDRLLYICTRTRVALIGRTKRSYIQSTSGACIKWSVHRLCPQFCIW